ncbi:glycosyltransferase family 4 protein [Pectobacterium odoriferum]|uniref:glycosyltransferase family 4 protein n=1 Tax=Pectobacterium TaxID=122277 RepID=UPI000D4BC9CE|nr:MULTISPECIES: glycosyltransferase family 4 protein [Pectobacterium]POE22193.1 hypothetical protein BV923_11400 [Pectobacterium odoriferum]
MNKKILFLVADITASGGIERVITHLASQFAIEGRNVEILSVHRSHEKIAYPLNDRVEVNYVDKKIKPLGKPGSFYKLSSHFLSAIRLNLILFKRRNNIVIANSFPISLISFPSVFFNHRNIVVEHVFHGYYGNILQTMRGFLYNQYDYVVALTDRDTALYKNKNLNATTIPNPLSFKPTHFQNPEQEKKKIVAVGRLEYQKGFDILINAFSAIEKNIKDGWELDIYGEGSLRGELQNLINAHSLEEIITLKGNVKDLHELYYQYDIFVFSSRFEGFGMVLLEAMSCALPCISFDCPTGPREILNNGKYGLLCDNENEQELKEKLTLFIKDKSLRAFYSAQSLNRSKDYDISHISQKWNSLFNRLT